VIINSQESKDQAVDNLGLGDPIQGLVIRKYNKKEQGRKESNILIIDFF
jgi:hypothetical protein